MKNNFRWYTTMWFLALTKKFNELDGITITKLIFSHLPIYANKVSNNFLHHVQSICQWLPLWVAKIFKYILVTWTDLPKIVCYNHGRVSFVWRNSHGFFLCCPGLHWHDPPRQQVQRRCTQCQIVGVRCYLRERRIVQGHRTGTRKQVSILLAQCCTLYLLQQVKTEVRLFPVLLQGDTILPPCHPHKPLDMDEGVGEVS